VLIRIKKNDTVKVLSGKDKGKHGVVLEVDTRASKAVVKGVAIVTRHIKAKRKGEISEIRKRESFINISKIMLVCGSCHKPSRVNSKQLENDKRVRVCNRCDQVT
jgi:large subunit ribosomal protein L24